MTSSIHANHDWPSFRITGSLADRLLNASNETGLPPRQILANSLKIHLNFIEDKLLLQNPIEEKDDIK